MLKSILNSRGVEVLGKEEQKNIIGKGAPVHPVCSDGNWLPWGQIRQIIQIFHVQIFMNQYHVFQHFYRTELLLNVKNLNVKKLKTVLLSKTVFLI